MKSEGAISHVIAQGHAALGTIEPAHLGVPYRFLGAESMDKKQKQRYALAVYLLLATLSVILALVGMNYYQETHPMRGFLINLSTELAGVVLIFFIVNQLFLLDRERDLSTEIKSLSKNIHARFSPLAWEEASRELLNLETCFLQADSIDLLGYNLANLLGAYREHLANSVRRGARVRILFVNPTGAALTLMRSATDNPQVFERDPRRSLRYISEIEGLIEQAGDAKGTLSVRLALWIPSCSLILVDGDQETGVAKVTIHSLSLRLPIGRKYRDRLHLMLSREEYPREFDYFKTQFDLLWEDRNTIPWDDTLPTSPGSATHPAPQAQEPRP